MSVRYYGLDLARAVFIMLGVVLHAALAYQYDGGWRVSVDNGSPLLVVVAHFIHMFRMPAFFIISGFFFILLVDRKGEKEAIIDRAFRLGIPLVFVGMTFNYLMNTLTVDRQYSTGLQYIWRGEWLGQLWFIGNLLGYCLLTLPIAKLFVCDQSNNIKLSRIIILPIIIFAVLCLSVLSMRKMHAADNVLFIAVPELFKFFSHFLLGMALYGYRAKVMNLLNWKASILFVLISAVLAIIVENYRPRGDSVILTLAYVCLSIGIIALLNTLGAKPVKGVKSMVESSYTVYLIHQPILICLFYVFTYIPLSPIAKFLIMVMLVYLICHVIHHKLVKGNNVVELLLNGVRRK